MTFYLLIEPGGVGGGDFCDYPSGLFSSVELAKQAAIPRDGCTWMDDGWEGDDSGELVRKMRVPRDPRAAYVWLIRAFELDQTPS